MSATTSTTAAMLTGALGCLAGDALPGCGDQPYDRAGNFAAVANGARASVNWAYWGTLEFFGGNYYFDAVASSTTINRYQVPSGAATPIGSFTALADMCSFVLSPPTGRWYWHHEGNSVFRSGDESIGFCDATFSSP